MEIQVKRLRDTLELLAPLVPRKATLKSLSCARLGEGRAAATDLEVSAAIDLPGADEDVLLPAKDALGFLKYTPGTAMAQITPARNRVTIAAYGMETSFSNVPDVEDFPPLPKLEPESEGVLNGDALVRALVAIAPYVASETDRPVLNGVFLSTDDQLEAVAADGFRLIWETIPGKLSGRSMIIPRKGVDILERLWKRAATPDLSGVTNLASLLVAQRLIRLNWDSAVLRLSFDAVTLFIKLTQGTFPNYRQLIPTKTQSAVIVMADDMERVLRQVAPVAKDRNGIVRLRWDGEELRVSAMGEDRDVSVPVPARLTEPGRTALNVHYLKEYFKGRSGPVTISTSSPQSPVLFTHRDRPHVLIMPMHVEWEPKPAVVAQAEEVVEQVQPEDEVEPAGETEHEPETEVGGEPKEKPRRERKRKRA